MCAGGSRASGCLTSLLPPTQVDDDLIPQITHILKLCVESALPAAPKEVRLKRYMAQGYVGLFLEEDAATWFRDITHNFASEVKKLGRWRL